MLSLSKCCVTYKPAPTSPIIGSGVESLGQKGATELSKFGKSGWYKASIIASGGLSGGISSKIAGGSFMSGFRQGLMSGGLNHVATMVEAPLAELAGGGKDKATIYIETDGLGHVYVEIGGTVYSYGRYDGSYSPLMGEYGPVGPGVLLKLDGDKALNFIAERTATKPTSAYSVEVDGSKVKAYYDKLYNAGKPLQKKEGYYKYGRVVDTYYVAGPYGNNCTTIAYKALNYGGANIGASQTPTGMNYDFRQSGYIKRGYNPGLSGPKR